MAWPWATALYGLVLSTRVPDAECKLETSGFSPASPFTVHPTVHELSVAFATKHLSSETTGKTPYETDLFCFFFILYMTEDSDTFSSTFLV